MRTLFFLLFLAVGVSAQAQIYEDTLIYLKQEYLLDELDRELDDLRAPQRSAIAASLRTFKLNTPKKATKQQQALIRQRMRNKIMEHLDPRQVQRLKAAKEKGNKDALDRIIRQSTSKRQ